MQRDALVQNKWLTVYEDRFELDNGHPCTYYHVQRSDAVMAIAVEIQEGHVFTHLVEQYRHPIGRKIWQFPLGGLNDNSDPVESARNELKEETGIVAGEIKEVASFYTDPGFSNQKMFVCLTSDIQDKTEQNLEDSESGLICRKVSLSEVSRIVSSKDSDAWTVIGYQALLNYVSSVRENHT